MTVAQDAYPGAPVYHYGWYGALTLAFFALAAASKKRDPFALVGCAIVAFAGAAAGLMAPDTHTIVGAPGATVRDDETSGSISFPLDGSVITVTRGSSRTAVDGGRRYTSDLIMWQQLRDVVNVTAADVRGGHLTITQPTNASFLSPVLLMQQSTAIAGMSVRVDSFSVPAVHANVKAVLFSPQQTAQLHVNPPIAARSAVLFDVSDQSDREVPGGIGIVASGSQKKIGGLRLGADVVPYPALVIASGPYVPALVLGLGACIAGAFRAARLRYTSA